MKLRFCTAAISESLGISLMIPRRMLLLCLTLIFVGFFLSRILYVLRYSPNTFRNIRPKTECCSIAVFLGSGLLSSNLSGNNFNDLPGGHTSEMLTMLATLDLSRYSPRLYIITEGDSFSARKAADFEHTYNSVNSPTWLTVFSLTSFSLLHHIPLYISHVRVEFINHY